MYKSTSQWEAHIISYTGLVLCNLYIVSSTDTSFHGCRCDALNFLAVNSLICIIIIQQSSMIRGIGRAAKYVQES